MNQPSHKTCDICVCIITLSMQLPVVTVWVKSSSISARKVITSVLLMDKSSQIAYSDSSVIQ